MIYLLIGLYFFVNIILAIYYSNYKNRVDETLSNFIDRRHEYLKKKFTQYDVTNKGYLRLDQFKLLICEILKISPKKNSKFINLDKIISMFDTVNGRISCDDFIEYFDIVDALQIQPKVLKEPMIQSSHFIHKLKKIIKHPAYDAVVSVFIVLNLLVLFSIDALETVITSLLVQISINLMFLVELGVM